MPECSIHDHVECCKVSKFGFPQFIRLSVPCFQFIHVENINFYHCLVNFRTASLLHNEAVVDAMLKCTHFYMENSVSSKGYKMNFFELRMYCFLYKNKKFGIIFIFLFF